MDLPHEYTCKQWCSACTLFANEWAASVNRRVMLYFRFHIFALCQLRLAVSVILFAVTCAKPYAYQYISYQRVI